MPWTSSIRRCARYRTAALRWPSKRPAKWVHFASLFVDCCPGSQRYIVSSRLMAASIGFRCCPGHAKSGDATCASTPPHGHQNGLRRGVIVAKDHINSLTTIWVRKSLGGNITLSGGNKKLPLRRFPTVGKVRKVPSTQTQLPPQSSSPWWCRLPLLWCDRCNKVPHPGLRHTGRRRQTTVAMLGAGHATINQ